MFNWLKIKFVDDFLFVISFMLGTENSNIDVSWTFENISEYPIYVSITSIMKENYIDITQTLTCSTSNFYISKWKNFQETTFEKYKILKF